MVKASIQKQQEDIKELTHQRQQKLKEIERLKKEVLLVRIDNEFLKLLKQ